MVPEAPEMPTTRRRGVLVLIQSFSGAFPAGKARPLSLAHGPGQGKPVFNHGACAGSEFEGRKGRQNRLQCTRREWADDALVGAEAVLCGLVGRRCGTAETAGCCKAVKRLLLQPLGLKLDRFDAGTKSFRRLGC